MARKRRKRQLKTTTYIFTEGETEKIYFNRLNRIFKQNTKIKIQSCGKQSLNLVEHANSTISKLSALDKEMCGDIYVVFDKDSEALQIIREAMSKAKKYGFYVIFSNECFDLWILAHFDGFTNRFMTRGEVYEKLSKKMSVSDYNNHKADMSLFAKVISDESLVNTLHEHNDNRWLSERKIDNNPFSNIPIKAKKIFKF